MLSVLVVLACQLTTPPSGPLLTAPSGGGGGGVSPGDVCLLAGSADCDMQGPIWLDDGGAGVAPTTLSLAWSSFPERGIWGQGVSDATSTIYFVTQTTPLRTPMVLQSSGGTLTGGGSGVFSWEQTRIQSLANHRFNSIGSAALPSIVFGSDTNTGFFPAGADRIGFSTAGTQKLELSTTQAIFALPVVLPQNTFGALTFSGANAGAGLYYDSSLNVVGLQGSSGSSASVVVSTAAGFGGQILIDSDDDLNIIGGGEANLTAGDDIEIDSLGGDVKIIASSGSLQIPVYETNGTTTLPPCDATHRSGFIWRNDTSDAVPGQPCVCVVASDNTTYSWVNLRGLACAP
jgi:hypothetical protein